MQPLQPPEIIRIKTDRVACDGSGEVSPELGFVECGYCDRRFVLEGGPADSKSK